MGLALNTPPGPLIKRLLLWGHEGRLPKQDPWEKKTLRVHQKTLGIARETVRISEFDQKIESKRAPEMMQNLSNPYRMEDNKNPQGGSAEGAALLSSVW